MTKATVDQEDNVMAIGLSVTITTTSKDGSGILNSISLTLTQNDFVTTYKAKQITFPHLCIDDSTYSYNVN